ncbi:TcaA 3rd/4th domain-containing protein [Oceanobacillus jeddahense]|uniref:DUF4878 domain-containing protein n=1 Tax=Oceanobacillus jeddahense TaxID=1462527 RepID=A0ABY5JM67_9BACI|nr:hypothetical protein [Oceanobacillus jeddahense]UUI01401.1 hypothetical protein NP439_15225 [Oceanobacillus jeddahense]
MQKKYNKKIYAFILFSLTVLFLSACSNNIEKSAQAFKEIVDDRDPEGLIELVTLEEGTYWTEVQAQQVIEFFHENDKSYQEQIRLLEKQENALDEDKKPPNGEGLFYFDEERELKARSYEVIITNSTFDLEPDQLMISIDEGDMVEIENLGDSIGSFGPGEYTFTAIGEFPYETVESTGEFSVMSSGSFTQSMDLAFEGNFVRIVTSSDDTKLLINGEETDIELGYMEGMEFGPIAEGNILQGIAEFPWESAQGEELMIDEEEEYDITPNMLTKEEDRESITELVNNYFQSKMAALVELEIDQLTEDVSEELRETLDGDIKRDINADSSHKGEVFDTSIDFESSSYKRNDDDGSHYVTLQVEIHQEYIKIYEFMRDTEPVERHINKSIVLEYLVEEDKWIISEEQTGREW